MEGDMVAQKGEPTPHAMESHSRLPIVILITRERSTMYNKNIRTQ